jgi:opacity protein-like surface antigen
MSMKIAIAYLIWLSAATVFPAAPLRADDADRFRPYLRFHSGDISSTWGVDDMWSFSLGCNLDRHWGGELGTDFYERDFYYKGTKVGEIGSLHLVPQVRLRRPFLNNRLVPYVIAGAGVSFLQFNDAREPAFGLQIGIEDVTFTVTAGGGLEYFISDNVTLGFEGKYFWLQPVSGKVDGQKADVDLSAPAFTVGLRVFLDENHSRPLADAGSKSSIRFFFGVRMGGAILADSRWMTSVKLEPESSSFGEVNQTGGLLFGWDLGRHWGLELAADSLEYSVSLDGAGRIGEYGMGLIIPQVRYRIPLAYGRWVPYLNAGVGIAWSEYNDKTPGALGHAVSARGIYPACSVGAGIEYFLVRNVSLSADVGWVYTWDHGIEVDGGSSRGDFSAFMSHLGFRVYLFD